MTRSTMVFWSAAAALAVGVGVLVAKRVPKLTSSNVAASPKAKAAQIQQQAQQHFLLKFVKDPEPVPQFNVTSFAGNALDPAEYRGKVLIVNFWATWCGPCRYEIPELMRLEKKFAGSVQVIGLSVDREATPPEVKAFAERMGVTYPVGMASDKIEQEFGGIGALPTSFVINRQGQIVQKHVGLVPEDYYTAELSYLVGKPVDAKVETFVDEGQIFPANVKNAKSIPGVDMSKLTPAQRKLALKEMTEEHCTCGCDYTVAQCRILDSACPVSLKMAKAIVARILREGTGAKAAKAGASRHAQATANR